MGCQKGIARHIVEQGADYVPALKVNQGRLYREGFTGKALQGRLYRETFTREWPTPLKAGWGAL
jgi:hypothetical protein